MNYGQIKTLVACFFVIFSAGVADASPRLEVDAVNIAKKYKNGNTIEFSCMAADRRLCKFNIVVDKKRYKFDYNFASSNLVPLLGSIRLYADRKIEGAVISTDVRCGEEEQKLVPSNTDASDCIAKLVVIDNVLVVQEIEVSSYPGTYYRELNQ